MANKLSTNLGKSCYIHFGPSENNIIGLDLDGTVLPKVNYCKYIGIFFDNVMKWNIHMDYVYARLSKFIGIFYKLQHKLPKTVLRNIYYAFVHPYLICGI